MVPQAVQYWVDNRPYDDRRNVSVIVLPDGQLGVGIEAVPIKPKFAKVCDPQCAWGDRRLTRLASGGPLSTCATGGP